MQNEKSLTSIIDRLNDLESSKLKLEDQLEDLKNKYISSMKAIGTTKKRCAELCDKILTDLDKKIDKKTDSNAVIEILKLYHEGKLPL